MARWVKTVCARDCCDTGAMKAQVSDEGRILSVHGDKNDTVTQSDNAICSTSGQKAITLHFRTCWVSVVMAQWAAAHDV